MFCLNETRRTVTLKKQLGLFLFTSEALSVPVTVTYRASVVHASLHESYSLSYRSEAAGARTPREHSGASTPREHSGARTPREHSGAI